MLALTLVTFRVPVDSFAAPCVPTPDLLQLYFPILSLLVSVSISGETKRTAQDTPRLFFSAFR